MPFDIDYLTLKRALRQYGDEAQFNQLQEELAELIVAVNKYRRNGDLQNLHEEMADVMILLSQITLLSYIDLDEIQTNIYNKIERLNSRLDEKEI